MRRDDSAYSTRAVIWGVFLMTLGAVLMLDRFGPWDFPDIWRLWPALFLVLAVAQLAEGRLGSALTVASIGTWLLACEFHWFELRYGNSWPILLVAVGLGIVVRALTGEDRWRCGR
jgi:hypothetical protein